MADNASAEDVVWHGLHEVPEDRMIDVEVGPLLLAIARRAGEWRIGWRREVGATDAWPTASVSAPVAIEDPAAGLTVQRFLSHRPGHTVRLRPLLGDRPVVARPEMPLMIPAGDEALIFVSTPVWVRVELPEPDRPLLELPTSRPSDTWFGPDTRHGVVAYASRTAARLEIANLPPLPSRAITRVAIHNQASTALHLERVSVPAPNLPLFADRAGGLWTSPLVAVRDDTQAPARVEVGAEPPDEAQGAELIAPAREAGGRSVFSRALHVLVG